MNPALPGGATGTETPLDATSWSATTRLGYAFVPYGELQQGTRTAPNPSELGIDVHLGTLQLAVAAPTRTALDLQLPFGSLVTRSIMDSRTDRGLGDLELRLRQGLGAWRSDRTLSVTAGAVVPTGPYVARSGAANLPPEASYLTLGRGTAWWIAEVDLRATVAARAALFSQLAVRRPLARTHDEFAWGTEARATLGVQTRLTARASIVLGSDLQWRGAASEPDPFSMERVTSANAGGWQWSLTPSVAIDGPAGVSIMVGARIPVWIDVTGNQLVPQIGGFVAVGYSRRLAARRAAVAPRTERDTPAATPGMITVVDYWATWCAPCARISAALAAAAPGWPDVRIVKVDATEWPNDGPDLPAGVAGLPAIEVFDASGRRVQLLIGEQALQVVEEVEKLRSGSAHHREVP